MRIRRRNAWMDFSFVLPTSSDNWGLCGGKANESSRCPHSQNSEEVETEKTETKQESERIERASGSRLACSYSGYGYRFVSEALFPETEVSKKELEERATALALEEAIYYNFKDGHFAIQVPRSIILILF